MAVGILMMAFGPRVASLRICSPATTACEISLKVQGFLEAFYSPGGLVLVLGVVTVLIGILVRVRSRRTAL